MILDKETYGFHILRLQGLFGKKAFEGERGDMIWETVRSLSVSDFVSMIDQMIASMRKPPMPQDFKEAIKGRRRYVDESTRPSVDDCRICERSGIVRAMHSEEGVDTLVLCSCKEGARQQWSLPIINDKVRAIFKISPLPVEWFRPIRAPKSVDEMRPTIQDWKKRIRAAELYWQKWGGVLSVTVPKLREQRDATETLGW